MYIIKTTREARGEGTKARDIKTKFSCICSNMIFFAAADDVFSSKSNL